MTIDEFLARFAIVHDLDHCDTIRTQGLADLLQAFLCCLGALKKAAVLADKVFLVISGQIAERRVGEDDRLIRLGWIGDAKGQPAVADCMFKNGIAAHVFGGEQGRGENFEVVG